MKKSIKIILGTLGALILTTGAGVGIWYAINHNSNDKIEILNMGRLRQKPTDAEIFDAIFNKFKDKYKNLDRNDFVEPEFQGEESAIVKNLYSKNRENFVELTFKVTWIIDSTIISPTTTKYIDENGIEQKTDKHDLSEMNIKKITQIGYYRTNNQVGKNYNNIITMPKTIEEVPEMLPKEIDSLTNAFTDSFSKSIIGIENWDTSNIIEMNQVFLRARNFDQDISSWDVSNVIDMSSMFGGATVFNQDLSNWNTSNVTDMSSMFSYAKAFNGDILNWNIENVTYTTFMFTNATSFDQDISIWNINKVKNMDNMFAGAITFNQDLSNWDITNKSSYGYDTNTPNWNKDYKPKKH